VRRAGAGATRRACLALLTLLAVGAEACGRADLVEAAGWLAANPPPTAPDVICHGDLHR